MNASRPNDPTKDWDKDPKLTPWEEEEVTQPPARRTRGRSIRDWLVLGIAVLLLLYVIGFLLVGLGMASEGGSSNSFFSTGNLAWIPIQGEISSSGGSGNVSYAEVVDALDRANSDPSVDGIFLDIDSPGGSVVASKQIVAKIRTMNKPVIAWMGELGASGGYYIASSTDYVMADGDTITGSIGVISTHPNVEELLKKLGVSFENVKTGELKDIGSPYNEFSEKERELFQELVNEAFTGFVNDVRTFRGDKLNQTKFDGILDGRIVSGRQALDIGLIDQIGTREEAILKAGELIGAKGKPSLVPYIEKQFSLSDLLFSSGVQFGKGFQSSLSTSADDQSKLDAK